MKYEGRQHVLIASCALLYIRPSYFIPTYVTSNPSCPIQCWDKGYRTSHRISRDWYKTSNPSYPIQCCDKSYRISHGISRDWYETSNPSYPIQCCDTGYRASHGISWPQTILSIVCFASSAVHHFVNPGSVSSPLLYTILSIQHGIARIGKIMYEWFKTPTSARANRQTIL